MMYDWQRRLEYLVIRHPESGIKPGDLRYYTIEEQWGIYLRLRNAEE